MNPPPTAKRVQEILEYDPVTGIFRWKIRPNKGPLYAGDRAGTINAHGRRIISINKCLCYASRLAWVCMMGTWPTAQIDHINLDRADDRWENLREATNARNNQNRGVQSNNTSGFKGVTWLAKDKRWRATITAGGKTYRLGRFDDPAAAGRAYAEAARLYHGEFARTT